MGGVISLFDRKPLALKGSEKAAAEIAQKRPEHETHLTQRPDHVKPYLMKHMDELIFAEFSPEYLARNKLKDDFSGVPIPLRKEDVEAFNSPGGLKSNILAENMARVLGIDPTFKYRETYVPFIEFLFGQKAVDNITRKAKGMAEEENIEEACIYFRAALVLKFNDLPAMYGYSRALRTMYDEGKKEDYVGNLKAEALSYLEMITEFYPRFDMAWYYLGYMYLNLGLYMKAKLAWDHYLKYGRVAKDRREIRKRLAQLQDPIEIEKGCNAVMSGRWSKGLKILEEYKNSRFNDWWPMWYYLGVSYARTDKEDEAIKAFKQALKLSPRHIESMEELVELYNARGERANAKKYRDKLVLIKG